MYLVCPHCQNTIEVGDSLVAEVVCCSCGSTIQQDEDATHDLVASPTSSASTLGLHESATGETVANGPSLSSVQAVKGEESAEMVAGWPLRSVTEYRENAPSNKTADRRWIGRFELIELVGSGTFGTVFKARDPKLDRLVALKVPRAGSPGGPEDSDRFFREARSAAQLRHPSIVRIHEVGEHDGVPFLVSDFVQGMTLADWLTSHRPTFRESAELVAEIADALQEVHDHGIIHRDVKPSNILLDDEGRPHITDFGLAKRDAGEVTMTLDGQVLGTPAYMSPEQARGEGHQVDGRSDVYSLGVILYLLLTGELPFHGTPRMLLHQVQHDEPKSLRSLNDRTPRDLETITLKAMAKEPSRRYARARDLADDLRRFRNGEAIHARPVGRFEKLRRRCQRNPLPASLAAALALAILIGFAGVIWMWRAADKERIKYERVNEFLNKKLLAQASPEFSPRGAKLTVVELLDHVSARLGGDFDGQPAIEASIRETIGSSYLALGQYAKAEPHLRSAVRLDNEIYGAAHRDTLQAVNQWNSLLDLTGRDSEAEPSMRHNLEASRHVLGPDDVVTLDAAERLGVALWHLSRLDEAESLLRHTCDDRGRVLKPEHPDTLRSVYLLSLLLRDRARYAEAETLARKYEHDIRCARGPNHPDNVAALANLAFLRVNQGKLAEAEPYYQRAAAEARRILGSEHPSTTAAANDYARLLRDLGRRREAEQALRLCLADRVRVEGPESRGANESRIDLGALLRDEGRLAEAEPLLREASELGPKTGDPAEALRASGEHGLLVLKVGKAAEAERILRQVLASLERVRGADHPLTVAYRGHLASALEAQGKATEAVALRRVAVTPARQP